MIKENSFHFSPPDVPEHLTSGKEFHRIHPIDPTTKISSNTFINDDPNCSFEDEENDDVHSQPVDRPDSQKNGGGMIVKAYALYDFNGKHIFFVCLMMFLPIFIFRSWQQWLSICKCRNNLCW